MKNYLKESAIKFFANESDDRKNVSFEKIIDKSAAIIFMVDAQQKIVFANQKAKDVLGVSLELQSENKSLRDLHRCEQDYWAFGELQRIALRTGRVCTEWQLLTADTELRWFALQGMVLNTDGNGETVVWTLLDTDTQHQKEQELIYKKQQMEAAIDCLPYGVLLTDHTGSYIVATNEALVKILELPCMSNSLLGESIVNFGLFLQDDLFLKIFGVPWSETIDPAAISHECKGLYRFESGKYVEIENISVEKNHSFLGACWVFRDVTDMKARELALSEMAWTDNLTGAYNRRYFFNRLVEEISLCDRTSSALLVMDIDRFKEINDKYGHCIGDQALKHWVTVMSKELRKSDLLGRIGGDEFAIVLRDVDKDVAFARAESMRRVIENYPLTLDNGFKIYLKTSFGIRLLDDSSISEDALFEEADKALYEAKRLGRNRCVIFSGSGSMIGEA